MSEDTDIYMGKIMGIDPGSKIGVSVFEGDTLLRYECVQAQDFKDAGLGKRLSMLYNRLTEVILREQPDVIVVEDVLPLARFTKSKEAVFWLVSSYAKVEELAYTHKIELYKYTPTEWKKKFLGKGNGVKEDVRSAVNLLCGLELRKKDHDVSDAIAIGRVFLDADIE